MDTMINKKNISILVVAVLLLVSGYIVYSIDQQVSVSHVKASWVTDLANDRKLVGICDNVFFGKVVSRIGNKNMTEKLPETQYSVEVIDNIKGNLDGMVIVNQQGGEINAAGKRRLILLENDKLLEPGKTYLLATRFNNKENWHTLVPYYGDIPVNDNRDMKDLKDSLIKMNDDSEIVSLKHRFLKAYQQQIPFDLEG